MASVCVDVELDEFDDEEILEATVDILKALGDVKPDTRKGKLLTQLRKALAAIGEPVEGPTTACLVRTPEELRDLVSKHPELYRFAEAKADDLRGAV